MKNHEKLPKIIPFDSSRLPDKPNTELPPGLKEIDGAAIGAVKPDDNAVIETARVVKGTEPANNTEFHLHTDGTLIKYVDRPDATGADGGRISFAPQKLLVDGRGQVFGIARNEAVADMICNGVNALNLAHIMQMKEVQDARIAAQAADNPSGEPPILLLPPGLDALGKGNK